MISIDNNGIPRKIVIEPEQLISLRMEHDHRRNMNVAKAEFLLANPHRSADRVRAASIESPHLPEKYVINDKATILIWGKQDKTIIRRAKDDSHNKRLAFLTAFFQKHSGLSKTKAKQYLDELKDESELNNKGERK